MFQIILSFFIMFLSEKKYFDLAQTFLLFFSEPKTNQIEHFYTIARLLSDFWRNSSVSLTKI